MGLRDDVPELLSVLTVSLNCAVRGEALSGSIRESLAMEIPVIASDISGNGELVLDRSTGLLFPPGDHEALFERLNYALSDRKAVREMASRGLALVRGNFTVETMADRTLRYYRDLLGCGS